MHAEAATKTKQRAAVALKTKAMEFFLRAQQPLPKVQADSENSSRFWSHLAGTMSKTGGSRPGAARRVKVRQGHGSGNGGGAAVDTGAECLEVVKLWAEKLPPI